MKKNAVYYGVLIALFIMGASAFADEIDDEDFEAEGYTCYGYPYNYCETNDDFAPAYYKDYSYPVIIHDGYGNAHHEWFHQHPGSRGGDFYNGYDKD